MGSCCSKSRAELPTLETAGNTTVYVRRLSEGGFDDEAATEAYLVRVHGEICRRHAAARFGLLAEEERTRTVRRLTEHLPVCKADSGADFEPCRICLNRVVAGETLRRLPCLHAFHRRCVDRWFRYSLDCPLCAQSVDDMIEKIKEQ